MTAPELGSREQGQAQAPAPAHAQAPAATVSHATTHAQAAARISAKTLAAAPASSKSKTPAKASKKSRKPSSSSLARPQSKKTKTSPNKKGAAEAAVKTAPVVAPTSVLIIDNGGDALKYGWVEIGENDTGDSSPRILPNATARLQHQWTVLVGDEIEKVKNPNSLQSVTRSTERGIVVDLGNQVQVWKRLLDLAGVVVPLHSEAAQSLGWKLPKRSVDGNVTPGAVRAPHSVAVLLLLPPFCPRLLLEQFVQVWLEDFGVSCVGFGVSSVFAASEHETYKTSCVVDMGWSDTQIVPMFKGKPIDPKAIRRMPLGGRHMVNMLKYFMSYRQYNLMDQEQILRGVLENLGYISLNIHEELAIARRLASGRRPYDRDCVLPDYQTTFHVQIRLTSALIHEQEKARKALDAKDDVAAAVNDDKENDDDDEDFVVDDVEDGDVDLENDDENPDENENAEVVDEDGDDSDEETADDLRLRVLKERADEERRKREQAEEEQLLRISVERFTIPEILFRPQDAGLSPDLDGLAQSIAKSICACPAPYRPALYQSIYVTGGLSQLPNLKERLERELRCIVPDEYDIQISLSSPSIGKAWFGAKNYVQQYPVHVWSINREEYAAASKRKEKAYSRLLASYGGIMI